MIDNTNVGTSMHACFDDVLVACPHCGDDRVLSRETLAEQCDPSEPRWLFFICDNEECPEGDFDWLPFDDENTCTARPWISCSRPDGQPLRHWTGSEWWVDTGESCDSAEREAAGS